MSIFKVSLVSGPRPHAAWEGTFFVAPGETLEDMHYLIQDGVGFDDDHGYEFYTARTFRSRASEIFDDESEQLYERTLASLFPLPPKQALFYRFDYGDDWIFQIKPARGASSAPEVGEVESGMIAESGIRPEQYLDEDE